MVTISRASALIGPLLAFVGSGSQASLSEAPTCLPAVEYAPELEYAGCYTDLNTNDRTLKGTQFSASQNSPEYCGDMCGRLGYKYAGVEYTRQCFCGSEINSKAELVAESQCNSTCPGNPSATCGQSYRVNIWEVTNFEDGPGISIFPDCTREPLCSNPVCDTSLSHRERAEGLLSLFTITEKLNNYINSASGSPRIGIRPYEWWNEALHGLASSPGSQFAGNGEFSYASSFPQPIVVGSAFDDDLVSAIGEAVSNEIRAFHNVGRSGITFYTPNVNTFRDPRWGRGMETPGEDPFHVQSYAAAILSGLEDESSGYKKVLATCKHYAANDFENWGSVTRHDFNAEITLQDLSEYYLPPFKTCAADKNVGSFMCSYNAINGQPLCANPYLLEDILRQHWGWESETNFVSTDCGAVSDIWKYHKYVATAAEAAALAIKAGTDLQCNGSPAPESITAAYDQGLITEADLDKALVRLWASQVSLGVFDPADQQPLRSLSWEAVNTPEAQQLAYDAAVSGSVLLKNEGILPLQRSSGKSYAFVGPMVEATSQMQGVYSGPAPYLHSPRYAAEKLGINFTYNLGSQVNGTHTSFDAAIQAAKNADIIVYMGGLDDSVEREAQDRTSIAWPPPQVELLRALAGLDKPVIIVQFGGGQIDDSEWFANANIQAILWVGYPGQSGGPATLNLLFGNAAPAGRLTVTQYPESYFNDVPPTDMSLRPSSGNKYLGRTYMWYTGKTPAPFGSGLHYTNFGVSLKNKAKASRVSRTTRIMDLIPKKDKNTANLTWNTILNSPVLNLAVSATNEGGTTSDYVALLFMRSDAGPIPRPFKSLVAYKRLKGIQPGQSASEDLTITLERLVRVDENGNRILHPGKYEFFVDLDEKATYELELTGSPVMIEQFPQPPAHLK